MDGEGMQGRVGEGITPHSDTQSKSLHPTPIFIAAEKNLETIGFFSPATKALRWMKKKQIDWRALRMNGSQKEEVEVSVTIDGSALGLPTTTDLDFYTAYQCILSRYIMQQRPIPDPLVFTTKELLDIAGESKPGGDQWNEVRTWLKRMQKTTIESRAAVYDAEKGQWIVTDAETQARSYQERETRRAGAAPKRDRWDNLQVFVQCHQEGEVVKGRRFEANVVYSAPWYKKNLERHWTKPIHASLYFRLRKPMAKILFRIGDGLLFAGGGSAHKRYDELCTLLGISAHQHEARILQQIAGPFDELQRVGYLNRWNLRRSAAGGGWVLEWFGGDVWKRIQKEIRGVDGSKDFALPARVEAPAPAPALQPADPQLELPLVTRKPVDEVVPPTAPEPHTPGLVPREQITEMIQLFRKLRGHPPVGRPPGHEVEAAESLLAEYGREKTIFIIEYACREIPKTSGRGGWGRVFGSVMTYVGEALLAYDRKREEQRTAKTIDVGPSIKELVSRRRAELSASELEILRQRAVREVDSNLFVRDWLRDNYSEKNRSAAREAQIERAIESFIEKELLAGR